MASNMASNILPVSWFHLRTLAPSLCHPSGGVRNFRFWCKTSQRAPLPCSWLKPSTKQTEKMAKGMFWHRLSCCLQTRLSDLGSPYRLPRPCATYLWAHRTYLVSHGRCGTIHMWTHMCTHAHSYTCILMCIHTIHTYPITYMLTNLTYSITFTYILTYMIIHTPTHTHIHTHLYSYTYAITLLHTHSLTCTQLPHHKECSLLTQQPCEDVTPHFSLLPNRWLSTT